MGLSGQASPGPDYQKMTEDLKAKLVELGKWIQETGAMLQMVNPGAAPLLLPIASAGKALEEQINSGDQGAGAQPPEAGPSGEVPARALAA